MAALFWRAISLLGQMSHSGRAFFFVSHGLLQRLLGEVLTPKPEKEQGNSKQGMFEPQVNLFDQKDIQNLEWLPDLTMEQATLLGASEIVLQGFVGCDMSSGQHNQYGTVLFYAVAPGNSSKSGIPGFRHLYHSNSRNQGSSQVNELQVSDFPKVGREDIYS